MIKKNKEIIDIIFHKVKVPNNKLITFENSNDKLYSTFFERAYNKKVLGEMWGKIFINEENPFT